MAQIPNTGIDNGLVTTTAPGDFTLDSSLGTHLNQDYFVENLAFDVDDGLFNSYNAPLNQDIGLLSTPSRGVALFDSPVPDFDFQEQEAVDLWSPQQRQLVSSKDIEKWFTNNYACKRTSLPESHMSEQNGGIWCKICRPEYTYWAANDYRQHKEETHGVEFKTGLMYWAPMHIRSISGVVGVGFEGYCATCRKWIPLDMSKHDFNWFYHASNVRFRGFCKRVLS